MPFSYPKKRSNPPIKRTGSRGFPDGWNTLPHASALKDSEVSELINGAYSQYGTIYKRLGTQIKGDPLTGSTLISQLFEAKDINDQNYLIRISDVGKPEYYNYATDTWVLLSGTAPVGYVGSNPAFASGVPTFSTTSRTWIVQANGVVYFANSVNELVYWDGTAWFIYAEVSNPSTKPTVAKTGSATGYTNYYYRYVDYNDVGGTLASPVFSADADGTGWKASMPTTLDSTTYLTVTLPAAGSGTTSRAIFRGTVPGEETFLKKIGATETVYVDKGELVASEIFGVPEANTTKGYHFYLLDTYKDTLIGTTVEMGAEWIVYSAGGDKIGSFGVPDGAGYIAWHKGDGEKINAIKSFVASNEDGLYLFKNSKIGVLGFDTEGATVRDVNVSIGSVAPLSVHVAGNNLRFWTREGAGTLGNEANYGTILRYSVLGIKTEVVSKQITPENLDKVAGGYIDHQSIFSISTSASGTGNNTLLVLDERYNAWSMWTGIYASVFCRGTDENNQERFFCGSSKDGNVLEMFKGKTDEATSTGSGNAIILSVTTKQYDMNLPDQYKKFNRVALVFGSLIGNSTTVQVFRDGYLNEPRLRIPMTTNRIGFGADMWGNVVMGSSNTQATSISSINTRYVDLKNRDMLSVKFNIMNDGLSDEIEFMGLYIYYSDSQRQLPFYTKLTELAGT
jgi:hypothetical protein